VLTIAVVCKETDPTLVLGFIGHYANLFHKYSFIVIDSGGGEAFRSRVETYIREDLPMHEARKKAISLSKTKYTLCLDIDTILCEHCIFSALKTLEENPKIGVVAADYNQPFTQGHLAFGASIWRTDVLQQIYKWDGLTPACECIYAWARVRAYGLWIEPMSKKAFHNKPKPVQ
jgi:hypothetical protein